MNACPINNQTLKRLLDDIQSDEEIDNSFGLLATPSYTSSIQGSNYYRRNSLKGGNTLIKIHKSQSNTPQLKKLYLFI